MSKTNENLDSTPEVDIEKEARINALKQLLGNTQADVVRAFEGDMPPEEYEALKITRAAWKTELAELEGETSNGGAENPGTDVLQTTIENQSLINDILGVK